MSLFGDTAIEAALAVRYDHTRQWPGRRKAIRRALDAAVAALDRDELIEKVARVLYPWEDSADRLGDARDEARAVLTALGLLEGDTASADQREGER